MTTAVEFAYYSPAADENGTGWHLVTATDKVSTDVVGELSWHEDGDIADISVSPLFRRRGIATGMYNYAFGCGAEVSPQLISERSDLGELWANSLGEDITPRAPLHLCPGNEMP